MTGPTLRGRLLVALPPLVDENFDRTVVLMLEHTDGGALGVVLNRPGERGVPSVLEPWAAYTSPPAVIFEGGPVETESVIGLALAEGGDDEDNSQWAPAFDGIGTIDLTMEQLEQELAAGAWVVADFRVDDAFGPEPAALWRAVLRRQGGQVAWMANYPDEPSLN